MARGVIEELGVVDQEALDLGLSLLVLGAKRPLHLAEGRRREVSTMIGISVVAFFP
jgi:hypothetical protein